MLELVDPRDPRSWKFNEFKLKEYDGVIKNSTWKVICRNGLPYDANSFKDRFVSAINDKGNNKKLRKTRLVAKNTETL